MGKITVTFIVNEKQLKDMDTTFKDELGWLENSGIHTIDIREEKTQEEYYQELVKSIITKKDFINLLVTNFNDGDLPTAERLAIAEFTTNWETDFKDFSD